MTKNKPKKIVKLDSYNTDLEVKHAKRNVSLLFFTSLVFVFAILFFPVIVPFIKQTHASLNTGLSVDSITSARQASEPDYDTTREMRISKLVDAGVIVNETPNYSRKADICRLAGQQQGWVTKNWAQYCEFKYIDLFETTLTRDELIQRIDAVADSSTLFGTVYHRYETTTTKCDNLYRSSHNSVLSFLDGSRGNNLQCAFSPVDQSSGSLEHQAVNIIRDFDIDDIDRSKSYIQLQSNEMYFNQKIGCGKSEFMASCSSPIKSPVSGF